MPSAGGTSDGFCRAFAGLLQAYPRRRAGPTIVLHSMGLPHANETTKSSLGDFEGGRDFCDTLTPSIHVDSKR